MIKVMKTKPDREIDKMFYYYTTREVILTGYRLYIPDTNKLLDFLESESNAYRFWTNPCIRKIYNISSYSSLLTSIYTDYKDEEVYDDFLMVWNHNPFTNGVVVNYSLAMKYVKRDILDKYAEIFSDPPKKSYKKADLELFVKAKLIKIVSYRNLLDRQIFNDGLVPCIRYDGIDSVILSNPLFIMGTNFMSNFIRLDTYNVWQNTLKKEWKDLKSTDYDIFDILDALVRSRKIFMDGVRKKERVLEEMKRKQSTK